MSWFVSVNPLDIALIRMMRTATASSRSLICVNYSSGGRSAARVDPDVVDRD